MVELNEHSQLYLNVRNLKVPLLSHRDWRSKCIWQKEDGGKKAWSIYDETDELDKKFPTKEGNVRAAGRTTWLFEAISQRDQKEGKEEAVPQTRATMVYRVDIKGEQL